MESYHHSGHKIKRNHSNALPRYIVAYDTETVPMEDKDNPRRASHTFRLGVALYCRLRGTTPTDIKVARFSDPGEFWAFLTGLTGPRHTVWVVCHNALFDMVVSGMPEQFLRSNLVIDWPRSKRTRETNEPDEPHAAGIAVIDSPPTIIACRMPHTSGRIVIVDTLNWFQCSLAELGDAALIPKYPMPEFSASDEAWYRYCERDAQIVFTTFTELIRWVRDNDMGMFRYTAPSQAMAAYRHRFMRHNIYIHDNSEVRQLERRSYFGGRTEVFRLGKIDQRVHQLDVNSLFPDTMQAGVFPRKLIRYEIRQEWLTLRPSIEWQHSVAEVLVETELPIFPCRRNGQIIYPVGRFKTVLCGEELATAISGGAVAAVRSWAEYECSELFSEWVTTLWGMRQAYRSAGNSLYEQFCKKLLNSLYGKFGQLAAEWINDPSKLPALPWDRWTEVNLATGERMEWRSFGWTAQRMEPRKQLREYVVNVNGRNVTELREEWHELSTTFPAISAFVTSAARCYMDGLRFEAGEHNVYYQGVDGLVVTDAGLARLEAAGFVDPNRLGLLRPICTVTDGEILGCSDYVLGGKTVISGRARPTFDHESGQLLQRKFAAGAMLFDGRVISSVDESLQPWQRVSGYTKGVPQPDGWVRPIQLAEDIEPLVS